MKRRNGFVANSSSSSYVCDVCGNAEGGYDIGLSDVGMCECVAGHTFCENHALGDRSLLPKEEVVNFCNERISSSWVSDSYKKTLEDLLAKVLLVDNEDWEDFFNDNDIANEIDYDSNYDLPSSFCPICTMTHVTSEMKVKYFAKKMGISEEELSSEIKDNFKTLKDFQAYVKK